jgi:hypothetical protein
MRMTITHARSRSFGFTNGQSHRGYHRGDCSRRLPDFRLVVQRLYKHYSYSYRHHRRGLCYRMDAIQPRTIRWETVIMAGLSRDEVASIALIGITVAVFAWYRTGLTGIQRWTNVIIVLLVSVTVATATTFVLKKWNPRWYRQ